MSAVVTKLKNLSDKSLTYCLPLVDALLAGMTKRFGRLLEDKECQWAVAFHPKFRLTWLKKYNSALAIER